MTAQSQPFFDDYQRLVLEDYTVIDVRAPVEFAKGSLPNAVNVPLLDDHARHQVGLTYREKGHDAAISLGHDIVSGPVKQAFLETIKQIVDQNDHVLIMCFRGGNRSKIVQQWLDDEYGLKIARLHKGYKGMRWYLLNALSAENLDFRLILLAGHTGAGKTQALAEVAHKIDLEALANHRGSSFGHYLDEQPTQVNFEHALAYQLIRLKQRAISTIVVEKEGKFIGRVRIPNDLWQKMQRAEIVLLRAAFDQRLHHTYQEYVVSDRRAFYARYGAERGESAWREKISSSIMRLEKRLGLERTRAVHRLFKQALTSDNAAAHQKWLSYLLSQYYDPMYLYQRQHWQQPVIFQGEMTQVIDYLNSLT